MEFEEPVSSTCCSHPPITQFTCLGCCCEFYMLEDIPPNFCPYCGTKLKMLERSGLEVDER